MEVNTTITLNEKEVIDILKFEQILAELCYKARRKCANCIFSKICNRCLKDIIINNFSNDTVKVSELYKYGTQTKPAAVQVGK